MKEKDRGKLKGESKREEKGVKTAISRTLGFMIIAKYILHSTDMAALPYNNSSASQIDRNKCKGLNHYNTTFLNLHSPQTTVAWMRAVASLLMILLLMMIRVWKMSWWRRWRWWRRGMRGGT